MFGKLGDMMGKLQEMKQKADEIKNRLDQVIVNSEGAGGDIKMVMTGNRKLLRVEIASSLQHGDKKELEYQLLKVFNDILSEVEKVNENEMKKAASGILPGL